MDDFWIERLRSFCKDRFDGKNLGVAHGVFHWDRVAVNGRRLLVPDADENVISAFAYIHDVERKNNGADIEHGERAACLINRIKGEYLKGFSDYQIEKLKTACRLHNRVHRTGDITIDLCFDSDRLDLGRVGIRPNPLKMATEIGKQCAIDEISNNAGKRFIFALLDTAAKYNGGVISDLDLVKGAFYKYGTYSDNRFIMIAAAEKYAFTDEALGVMLRTTFTFGAAPKTKLDREELLFNKIRKCYYMNSKEIEYYNSMPEKVTIYRGTSKNEWQSGKLSPSWTDDLDKAIGFALHGDGYEDDKSERIVIKAEISKKDIKAVFHQGFALVAVREIVFYYHGENNIEIVYETKNYDPNIRYFSYKQRVLYLNNSSLKAAEVLAQIDGTWPK